jgi:hypothetical protein
MACTRCPKFRAGSFLGSQHIAGRKVSQSIFINGMLGLSALACARRAEKYDVEHKYDVL